MPIGASRLSFLAKSQVAAAADTRSWDNYDGSADSSVFSLRSGDTFGSCSCVLSSTRMLLMWMDGVGDSGNPDTIHIELYSIDGTEGSYGITLLDSDTIEPTGQVADRQVSLTGLTSTKAVLYYYETTNGDTLRVIDLSSDTVTIGAVFDWAGPDSSGNTTSYGPTLMGMNSGANFVLSPRLSENQFRQNLFSVSGTTITYQDSLDLGDTNSAGLSDEGVGTVWVQKLNETTYTAICGLTDEDKDVNFHTISISGNSFNIISTTQNIISGDSVGSGDPTNNTSTWSDQGVNGISSNYNLMGMRAGNGTDVFPGFYILESDASGTHSGSTSGNDWPLLLDTPKTTSDFKDSAYAIANPYAAQVQSGYWVVTFDAYNSPPYNGQHYKNVAVVKKDTGTHKPALIGSVQVAATACESGESLFHFDKERIHRVDDDTALLIYESGRVSATSGNPNGGIEAKFIKAPETPVAQRTAKTITAINNAQIDTAQYQFGGSSLYVDGVDDYLSIPNSGSGGDFDFGSNDFTVEAWVRPTSVSGVRTYVAIWSNDWNNDDRIWWFGQNGANVVFYYYTGDNNTVKTLVATTTAPLAVDTWYHVAVTGDSSNFKIYVDGSLLETETRETIDPLGGTGALTIGCTSGDAFDYQGHIDEVRISNNVRYTTGFTPSTTPFVNDSNTTLLVHADGTDGDTVFIDDNGDRLANGVQAFGNAQITTTQNKIDSASLSFDGTNSYVQLPYSTDLAKWNASTGYTLEYWVKLDSLAGTSYPDGATHELPNGYGNHAPTSNVNYWSFGPIDNGNVVFFYYNGGKVTTQTSGVTLSTGTWYHLAFVYDGSSGYKIYVDGTERASGTVSGTPQFSSGYPISFGAAGSSTVYMDGYIDELRVSSTARYTSGFTPSASAFTNDANTLLLLHFEEGADATTLIFDDNGHTNVLPPPDYTVPTAAFTSDASTEFLCSWDGTNGQTSATDESSNSHTITFSGASADLSTTQAKFGTASVDLNFSSTDSIYFGDSGTSAWYNQDTTIECWVYYDTLTGAQASNGLPRVMGSFVTTGGGNYWSFGAKNDGSLQFFYYQGSGQYVTSATGVISAGQWHHIAMVYNHSTGAIRLLCDGFEVASGTKVAGSFANHGYVRLGNYSGTPDAYVDEIRISHTQRY